MATESHYDVVIVGARCAGATLATFLARAGSSVLVLDKDRLPSDQILSTHTIHPPGLDVLTTGCRRRSGAAASRPRVSCGCEKTRPSSTSKFPMGEQSTCPRRAPLDRLLQDAAVSARVELVDRTRVTSLVRDDDRVVGVRATGPQVRSACFGRASLQELMAGIPRIARQVDAEEDLANDAPREMYWGYWNAPAFLVHGSGVSIRDVRREHRGPHPRVSLDRSRSASHRPPAVRGGRTSGAPILTRP